MTSTASVLRITGLGCSRGHRVLFSGLEFSLQQGQSLQLTGANGAGKTTLLKTLCGLRRPDSGQVFWNDADVHAQFDGYGAALIYIGHDNALNPDLTPRENLRMLSQLFNNDGNLSNALGDMGLSKIGDRPCRALSAGQRRRVALARLALCAAPLWILDEPAAALDTAARGLLGARIAEHLGNGGLVVFTTHEPLPLPGVIPKVLSLDA